LPDFKFGINLVENFKFLTQNHGILSNKSIKFGTIGICKTNPGTDIRDAGIKEDKIFIVNIIDPFKLRTVIDGPTQRAYFDKQLFFNVIQKIKGVIGRAVHFVDKNDYGCLATATDTHELFGLRFNPFGRIDDNNHTIDGCECPKSIFLKILVTRCVQNIDLISVEFKTHYRGSHRNTALPLNLHKVGGCTLFNFIAFNSSCNMDGTSEKEEFFGKRCFPRIRVTHNTKGSPA